ncbi:MAG: CheR family methyltransferase [Candidatus Zixiibacteriota bacterium]
MPLTLTQSEFDLLRNFIKTECGIDLPDGKEYLIESRLSNLMAISGSKSYLDLYHKASRDKTNKFRDKIIDAITTNETSWFRDDHPYTVLEKYVLPERIKYFMNKKTRKIRIWSAACSTGQEPYSIAMIINQLLENPEFRNMNIGNFEILATDISNSALLMAKLGRYDSISMSRGIPELYLNKYFKKQKRVWILNDEIKKIVTFKKFNLQNPIDQFGLFDIVFCRNVAIYFSEKFKIQLFDNIASQLKPDGYFFMGSAESISNYSNRFNIKRFDNSICYQIK